MKIRRSMGSVRTTARTRRQQDVSRWVAALGVVVVCLVAGARSSAVSVVVERAVGQADRTSQAPVRFSVVFSEAVEGFSASDLSLAPSTATGRLQAAVTGSGSTYEVTVTGMDGPGTVALSIPAGAASDAGGRGNTRSTSSSGLVSFQPPQASIPDALQRLVLVA